MSWIQNECGRAVKELRGRLELFSPKTGVFVHFQRGKLLLSPVTPEGFEKAYPLRVPVQKSDAELVEWLYHVARGLPCCP